MEHEILSGNTNLGIFHWDEPTKRVPFTAEPEIPEILTKWWKAPHEKIFATECRRRDCWKPNENVKKTKKQTAVVDFEELTLLLGEDDPHLKIYFRRREDLKMRGFPPPSRQKEAM